MAVIQKIRTKYGKLAGGIIAVALVGFILMDAASGRFGDMLGRDGSVLKINGEKVDQREYQTRVKEYETLYSMFNKDKNVDDAMRAKMDEQALHLLIFEKTAETQCDKLGIITTKDEQKELIYGSNPDPLVQQFQIQGTRIFANRETGQFDPQYVKAFEQQAAQIDPSGKAMETWETLKTYTLRSNRFNKFNTMFIGAIYAPKYLAEREVKAQYEMANINFVKVPLTTVPDNEVKITDEDLNAYIKKHYALFTADEASRSIDYVSFDIKASKDDTAKAVAALDLVKKDFETTKDNESFVNRNSDEQYAATATYTNKKTFMSPYADSIMKLPVDAVFGPYVENNSYKLTKVLDKKDMPDSVKCRHILVETKAEGRDIRSDSVAKQKIDSMVAAIKGGAKFDSLVKLSDDGGSNTNHGEYTFTVQQKEGLAKEFGDFIFEGKTGEAKVVKVSNDKYSGYHYIEIMEQKGVQPTIKMVTISKQLFASDNTVNGEFAKASEFAGKNTTAAQFDSSVKKGNLNKRVGASVKMSDFVIKGIGPSREIIRWMYQAKTGDISPVFTIEGRYVVAKLTNIQEKGLKKLSDDMRPMLEARVRAEKKGDLLAKKYNGMTLDAIAKTLNGQVQHADSVKKNAAFMPVLGYAPKLVGYCFYPDFKPNAVSPAIKVPDGVYFMALTSRWSIGVTPAQMRQAMMQQMQQMNEQVRSGMGQMLQEAISRNADIKYNVNNM